MRDGWIECKFKEVAVTTKGKLPKEKNQVGKGLPYLTANYLRSKIADFWIDDLVGTIRANNGDCLILWDGAGAGDLFSTVEGVVSSTMAVVTTSNPNVLRDFLTLFISSKSNYIKETCRGTTVPHVSPDAIANMELIIPPLHEQKRIVDLISSVGSYIDALQQHAENAKKSRNAVLHEMLSAGGDGWRQDQLGNLLKINRGGSPRPIRDYITDDPNGISWVKIADATASSKYVYETKQRILRSGVERSRPVKWGDFILSNSMSYGRPYIMRTEGAIHDGWLLLSEVEKNFDEDFLYNLLLSDSVQKQFDSLSAGSGVQNLNIDVVKKVNVTIPIVAIQQDISRVLNEFDVFLLGSKNLIFNAKELRSDLLSDLLSGEHEIPESYDKVIGAA